MTEDPSERGAATASSRVEDDEGAGSSWRRWSVLLPALAFVAGLLLGGAVIGATLSGNDANTPEAGGASPSPTASVQPDVVVTVPGPCVQAADKADEAYALLERGVRAARDLDARGLADLVEQVQQQRPEVERLVTECRTAAGEVITEPATPAPAPLPSPLPSPTG